MSPAVRSESAPYTELTIESDQPIAAQLWTIHGRTVLAVNATVAPRATQQQRIERWAEARVGVTFAELSLDDFLAL